MPFSHATHVVLPSVATCPSPHVLEAWLDAVGSVTDARAVRAWLDESGYLEEDLKDMLVMDEEEQAALAAAIGTPAAGGLVRDALRAPGEKAAREKAAREKAALEAAGVATTVEAWLDAVGSVTDARAVRALSLIHI